MTKTFCDGCAKEYTDLSKGFYEIDIRCLFSIGENYGNNKKQIHLCQNCHKLFKNIINKKGKQKYDHL